ncbi:MAG: biotin transporter BioY [Hyphomicrobiaceae bacterium]
MSAPTQTLLAHTVWPEQRATIARAALLALAGTALLALSAKVQVPFWPVQMTMQSYVVLLIGATLGARLGAATVLLYLAEGALGLPVFAGTPEKGLGLAYMMGPTGGYLVGFVAAAYVVGLLAERGWDRSIVRLFAAMALGHVIIFALGVAWLGQLVGLDKAWLAGVVPFYAATVFKTALGAVTLPAVWALVARR